MSGSVPPHHTYENDPRGQVVWGPHTLSTFDQVRALLLERDAALYLSLTAKINNKGSAMWMSDGVQDSFSRVADAEMPSLLPDCEALDPEQDAGVDEQINWWWWYVCRRPGSGCGRPSKYKPVCPPW